MPDNSIELNSVSSILFVGNSFTFGRVDPVMSYNTEDTRDLTAPVPGTSFTDGTGGNVFEPHPWGGVPGVFEVFAEQVGLDLDVALSTRNAATLQGHYLNSNPAGWDLRGNVASQSWDTLVLQDNSTRALPSGSATITFAPGESTARLILDPNADDKTELDETVSLSLREDAGYQIGTTGEITGTILDGAAPATNPALPTVAVVAEPHSVQEDGAGKLIYSFSRSGPTDQALTVDFQVARDGSTAPSVNTATGDFENFVSQFSTSFSSGNAQTEGSFSFTSGTGSVVIPAGASTATLTLDPRADTNAESNESVYFTLAPSDRYNVGTALPVKATIQDDDGGPAEPGALPVISFGLSASAVFEDGADALIFEFSRTGPVDEALTVDLEVGGSGTLPGKDFAVTGADIFSTAGSTSGDLESFQTYAVKLAEFAKFGLADGEIAANPNANAATQVYLYETWARPNLVVGAQEAESDELTGEVTTLPITAPEFYLSLEDMTEDLRAAYQGLAAANPIFEGAAPVGTAFLQAVQNGTAIRDPYTEDAAAAGKVNLWWDDNLHASKYGSYLSALTLFGKITGFDPRSLGANERAASELGITATEARALQDVAAATLGFSSDVHWTAPGMVTELASGQGTLATSGAFGFADTDMQDTHSVSVRAVTSNALGSLSAVVHTDSTGDGTGGQVNWTYTVDNAAIGFLNSGQSRSERFIVELVDDSGDVVEREIVVDIVGTGTTPGPDPEGGESGSGSLIEGTSGDDMLEGGAGNDILAGLAGNDTMRGGDGADLFEGGAGDDRAWAGDGDTGRDRFFGGAGNDAFGGNQGNDFGKGDEGNDTLWGGEGADTLRGGVGSDLLGGGAGDDALFGDLGDDIIWGGAGADTIYAGSGADVAGGAEGHDKLFGGAGNDTLFGKDGQDEIGGGAGDDVMYGGAGQDTIYTGGGTDTAFGGAGADVIYIGSGSGELYGGDGSDDFTFTDGLNNGASDELVIRDYEEVDRLILEASRIQSYDENGDHVKISYGGDLDSITIYGAATLEDLNLA